MLNKVMISRITYKNKGGPRTPVEKEMQDKICLMYLDGGTIHSVSLETGVAPSTVRSTLRRNGVLRSIKEALSMPKTKERMSKALKGKQLGKKRSPEVCRKVSLGRRKWARENAKGYRVNTNGYYEYTMGINKHRHVHVVVMEKYLGRKLKANEVVHHIDKNKHNNSINNLQVMTASDHARLHAKETYTTRKRLENGRFA